MSMYDIVQKYKKGGMVCSCGKGGKCGCGGKMKRYEKGGEVDPKYRKAEGKEQTPEEKLVDAIASQGRGAQDLMYMLSSMRSPTEQERRTAMFSGQPVYEAPGRAYRASGDRVYYQPADEAGELIGTGRLPTSQDVRSITGGRGELSSKAEREVARMLQDPAVMRFFMDVYSEAGKSRKAQTTSLSGGKPTQNCQPDRTGKIPESCKKGGSWSN